MPCRCGRVVSHRRAREVECARRCEEKTAWLAKRRGKLAKTVRTPKTAKTTKATKRIPWKQLSRLDGADLTQKAVVERLIRDTDLFPDAPSDSFETSDGGGPRPAGHEFTYRDENDLEYRVVFG